VKAHHFPRDEWESFFLRIAAGGDGATTKITMLIMYNGCTRRFCDIIHLVQVPIIIPRLMYNVRVRSCSIDRIETFRDVMPLRSYRRAILSSNEFVARKWITSTLRRTVIDIANLRVVLLEKVAILIVDAKAICPTTFTFAMSWRSNNAGHEGSDRNYPHRSYGNSWLPV